MPKSLILIFSFFITLLFVKNVYAAQFYKVVRVVDGDTIVANDGNINETVRLLGIDTPETVDPRKPVQCFGKAASDKMKSLVQGKSVLLVEDNTQGNRDKYNRLLRYVYLPDNRKTFVNGEMVKQGFAFSYRQYPTKYLDRFNSWEKYAREHKLGLWSSCPASPASESKDTLSKPAYLPFEHMTETEIINLILKNIYNFLK